MYPQWFIDELVNEEDKEKARNGSLRSTDIVTFICEKGHVYKQKVCRHIIIGSITSLQSFMNNFEAKVFVMNLLLTGFICFFDIFDFNLL